MESTNKIRHPKGLYVLFFTEMWERFGYYTMMALLALYMDEHFKMPKEVSGQIYGLFIGLVYFTPLIGGWLADRFLGYRKSIVIGAVLMGLGYTLLSIDNKIVFFLALLTVIIGNGFFKPNISTMVGNLYSDNDPNKDSAFNIFYMGINIGAFVAPLAAAFLRQNFGYGTAFIVAGVGMGVCLIIFLACKKFVIMADSIHKNEGEVVIELTKEQEKERIVALLTIFGVVILFWMTYNQNGYTLIFWARDCTNLNFVPDPASSKTFGWFYKLLQSPETYQAINPLFIIFFTYPLVMFWNFLGKFKKEPATPLKMIIGMILTAICYLILYFGALKSLSLAFGGVYAKVSISWLLSSYVALTMGELCLSPMGLAFCAKVAPPKIRGLMMGGWFAASAIGNYASGVIGSYWDKWSHPVFFIILVFILLFGALLLVLALKYLTRVTHSVCEQQKQA